MTKPENDGEIGIRVEFTGGLELLFSNQKLHDIRLPRFFQDSQKPVHMGYLIWYLCENLMQDRRKDMFVVDGAVRPGVLVLINDADWELEGEVNYELSDGDGILFVSTLHGG